MVYGNIGILAATDNIILEYSYAELIQFTYKT